MITRKQALIAIIFLLLLMNSYYYNNHVAHQKYLENREAIGGINGKALLSGIVSSIANDGFYLQIKYGSKSETVKILSDVEVQKGDWVEAIGWISQGRMVPEKMAIKGWWSYHAVFIISAMTVPFVLYLFLRSWGFDFDVRRFRKKYA